MSGHRKSFSSESHGKYKTVRAISSHDITQHQNVSRLTPDITNNRHVSTADPLLLNSNLDLATDNHSHTEDPLQNGIDKDLRITPLGCSTVYIPQLSCNDSIGSTSCLSDMTPSSLMINR